jgi:hypothetical protein
MQALKCKKFCGSPWDMENTQPSLVWVIHYHYCDGSAPDIVDRAYAREEDARWQIKLLHDLCDGRQFSLHSLPVHQ